MNQQEKVAALPQSNIAFTSPEFRQFSPDPALGKAKAAFRANYLTAYYGAAYISPDNARNIHVFDGSIWEYLETERVEYDAACMLDASGVDYDPTEVTNIIKVMRQRNPRMGLAPEHLISFKNGVLDTQQNIFRHKSPFDWLTTQNGIIWGETIPGENLPTHAPNFYKWLSFVRYDSEEREEAILAALYMVLMCRHNWEMFFCLTGTGGAGKSVMQRICTMLAGEHNMAAIDIDGICGDFGLEHLLGKRLFLASETPAKWPKKAIRIVKAITGGDAVMVNRKGEKVVSVIIRSILTFTGNTPFDFGTIDSGLERRAINFGFWKAVPDSMKDDQLTAKIAAELPVVIRYLLARFPVADTAKQALIRQRDGAEAKQVKYEGSPLERFLSSLEIDPYASLSGRNGMQWNAPGRNGSGHIRFERQFVHHAYLSFCDYEGIKPALDMRELRSAINFRFGADLRTGKGTGGRRLINLRVRDDAEYLPCSDKDSGNVINFSG